MEGLGIAANVIAVVDISAQVAALCLQYSKEVVSARAAIQRLHSQVGALQRALRAAQRLIEGTKGDMLSSSRELVRSLHDCVADLEGVEKKLNQNPARVTMCLRKKGWVTDLGADLGADLSARAAGCAKQTGACSHVGPKDASVMGARFHWSENDDENAILDKMPRNI